MHDTKNSEGNIQNCDNSLRYPESETPKLKWFTHRHVQYL